jgi:hypothetical protein
MPRVLALSFKGGDERYAWNEQPRVRRRRKRRRLEAIGMGSGVDRRRVTDEQNSDLPSRRTFLRGVCGATAAAGAAMWVAPQFSSVALAADGAGSDPPKAGPEGGGVDTVPDTTVTGASRTSGTLPQTGPEPRTLLVTGTAAVAAGTALLGVSRTLRDPLAVHEAPSAE